MTIFSIIISILIVTLINIFFLKILRRIKFEKHFKTKVNKIYSEITSNKNIEIIKYYTFFGIAKKPMNLCVRYFLKIYEYIEYYISFALANSFCIIFISGSYLLYSLEHNKIFMLEFMYFMWSKFQDIFMFLTFAPIIIFLLCLIVNIFFPKKPKTSFSKN